MVREQDVFEEANWFIQYSHFSLLECIGWFIGLQMEPGIVRKGLDRNVGLPSPQTAQIAQSRLSCYQQFARNDTYIVQCR